MRNYYLVVRMENYKNREWLLVEYEQKKRTANEIAKDEARDAKTIWSWLKRLGIATRPRGGASSSGSFANGHKLGVGRRHTNQTKAKIREAALKDGRVPWGKGNEPYWKGVTGASHPAYKGGLTPERQAVYSSQEWVSAVKEVWARDNATCQRCGVRHNTETNRGTFHIHHLKSFQVAELRTEPSNLVLLCKPCHLFVHSKKNTNNQFIKQ